MSAGSLFCHRAIKLAERHREDLERAGQSVALEALLRLAQSAREALAEGGGAPDRLMRSELQRLVPQTTTLEETS